MSSVWCANHKPTTDSEQSQETDSTLPSINPGKIKQKKQSKTLHISISEDSSPQYGRHERKAKVNLTNLQTNQNHPRKCLNKVASKHNLSTIVKSGSFHGVSAQSLRFGLLEPLEQLLSHEVGISKHSQALGFKKSNKKVSFGKLMEMQSLLDVSPKALIEAELDQILKVFSCSSQPKDREKPVLRSRKTTLNSIFQKSEKSLFEHDKLEILKRVRAFQKSERHLTLKSFGVRLLYHQLAAEVCIELGHLEQAISSLRFYEYFARKIDQEQETISCLCLQAEILHCLFEHEEEIKTLKTALELSIVKKFKELECRILEKISLSYYYRGNSYMSRYYKKLVDHGIPQSEIDIYVKEYSKADELKSLEHRLFSIPFYALNKKKHNEKYEEDISRDMIHEHQRMVDDHQHSIHQMLKSNQTSKTGILIRQMIKQNAQNGEVRKITHQKQGSDVLPRFIEFDYPLEHCSQILKSHLSRNRSVHGSLKNSIDFEKTFTFLKTTCHKLREERENKENMNPFAA